MLSCEFCKFLKNTFFTEHLRATASEQRLLKEIKRWNTKKKRCMDALHGCPKPVYSFSFTVYQRYLSEISNCCHHTIILQKQPPEVIRKKTCSYKFRNIHRKTTVPESLFNTVAPLRPATLLKKRLWHWCFPVNFAKFLRIPFLQNTSGWLLLI